MGDNHGSTPSRDQRRLQREWQLAKNRVTQPSPVRVYFRNLTMSLQTKCRKVRRKGEIHKTCVMILNITNGLEKRRRAREHPTACALHVPNFIVRVPRDADTLRATVRHSDFNTSCLQRIYNQPPRSCEVVKVTGSNPQIPLGQ